MNDKTLQERYLRRILNSKVYDVAIESPLEEARVLSRKLGNRFLLKREDLQCVHSFKLRAQRLGCKATIVMPVTTPEIKIASVKNFGASIVLSGDSYSDAAATAARLVSERDYTFIPPYDDPDVIAGQGTVAMEILRQKLESENVVLTYTPAFEDAMVKDGYDPVFGARPVKRLIQRELVNQLAREILEGKIHKDSAIEVDCVDGQTVLRNK